jgi:hypothetical protein
MTNSADAQQQSIAALTKLGARIVEDHGQVQLVDLADAPIRDADLELLTPL